MSLQQAQWPVRQLGRAVSENETLGPGHHPAITLVFVHAESIASSSWKIRLVPVAEFARALSEIGSQRPDLVLVPLETLAQDAAAPRPQPGAPDQPTHRVAPAIESAHAAIATRLAAIRRDDRQLPVIVTVPASSRCGEAILHVISAGASDVATDATSPEALREKMIRLVQRRRLQRRPAVRQHASAVPPEDQASGPQVPAIVGTCEAMISNIAAVARAATCNDPVLICGEPGTGKSLFARTLHHASALADRPPTVIDCAQHAAESVDQQLLESRSGLFQLRSEHGPGTLIIENIDHAAPQTQRRLLAVLRRLPLSGQDAPQSGPRLVMTCSAAGTNIPLDGSAAMANGCSGMIAELYYELCGQMIELPPLRWRGADIAVLIDHFIRMFTATAPIDHSEPEHRITAEAKRILMAYNWPGNVAQLRSVLRAEIQQGDGTITQSERLERLRPRRRLPGTAPAEDAIPTAAIDAPAVETAEPAARGARDQPQVQLDDLSCARAWSTLVKVYDDSATAEGDGASLYAEAIQAAEAGLIMSVLENTEGNLTQAARLLGITRVSLRRKIHALGLQIPGR